MQWDNQCKEEDPYGIITVLSLKEYLNVQHEESEIKINEFLEKVCSLNEKEFCMRDFILSHLLCAACDGIKKDYLFRGCCIITDVGISQSLRKICRSNR